MAEEEKKRMLEGNDLELGEKQGRFSPPSRPTPAPRYSPSTGNLQNNPILPVLSYCGSSILMTVANKYILSFPEYNLNFFLLAVQAIVCVVAISSCKAAGIITYRDFKSDEAKKWFPISLLLIGMIYTSTKALRFLSIPVYTIFKNLTIILIAYGEVLWFGGSVSSMALLSFGLMVLSSVVAAWADIRHALESHGTSTGASSEQLATLNAGYMWMLVNCLSTAAYVLGMRKRIKITNFKDFDTMFYNNLLTIPILLVCSLTMEDWSSANMARNFPLTSRNAIISAMIFTGMASIFISYTSAWCVRATSSTTYSMVGALNKLPIAISGLVFFDAPVTLPSVTAIAIGFVSGIVYAVAKVREGARKATGSVLPTSKGVVSASSQSSRDSLKG
ncbi:GDP-mannose transporter [Cyphellophora europaea CBS 101466]|uniref:GDP-mannose transporter n=1 Tax=Cyphellophora europaea (strain CBS 101466) TaxID=1220924 RepID=W2RWS2_CYPE1|nr:GDP-mannose transporter [Cyphellophora europaea CBS 101466]ETN40785.1 GDP-mannose transporter [Cyphellophora europaea CBS 101466]